MAKNKLWNKINLEYRDRRYANPYEFLAIGSNRIKINNGYIINVPDNSFHSPLNLNEVDLYDNILDNDWVLFDGRNDFYLDVVYDNPLLLGVGEVAKIYEVFLLSDRVDENKGNIKLTDSEGAQILAGGQSAILALSQEGFNTDIPFIDYEKELAPYSYSLSREEIDAIPKYVFDRIYVGYAIYDKFEDKLTSMLSIWKKNINFLVLGQRDYTFDEDNPGNGTQDGGDGTRYNNACYVKCGSDENGGDLNQSTWRRVKKAVTQGCIW